jgi:hypothetical protein
MIRMVKSFARCVHPVSRGVALQTIYAPPGRRDILDLPSASALPAVLTR